MADFYGSFSGRSGYRLRLSVNLVSQNAGANTSTVSWSAVVEQNGGSDSWYLANAGSRSVDIGGQGGSFGGWQYDFRAYDSLTIMSGSYVITHGSDGNKTISNAAAADSGSQLGSAYASGSLSLPRIAKAPTAPGTPAVGTITTSSVDLSWSGSADNNGATITSYGVQRATNSGFTAGTASNSFTGTSGTVSSLASGTNYWFRVEAANSAGTSAWSAACATATLPAAPTALTATNETPSSFTLNWTAPTGTGITQYRIQQSTAADFTGATTWDQAGVSRAISGLEPAATYYYRTAALTAGGWGAWSASFSVRLGLPAPTLTSVATETVGYKLRTTWTAPSITTGLIGYRIQTALDSTFTTGSQVFDVGVVLTSDLTLTGGRRYWVRVAARTAGGVNTWSATISTVHTMSAGQLDGWTRTGTKPAGITYYTTQGIRRAPVGTVVSALNLESLATASATLAADTFGIQRTVTGLKVGASYKFQAKLTGRYSAAPNSTQGRTYRLGVNTTLGTTAAITTATQTITLPEVEFIASATSMTLKVLLADALTVPAAQNEVEQVAIHTIKLFELASDYPQRLRSTVYESSLSNHFDLACSSVGATWYVDRAGTTRFNLPGAALPVSAVFSDTGVDGALEYIDIAASYDTRSMVNRLRVTNYGLDAAGVNELNDELVSENLTSITEYGAREERLTANLHGGAPYTASLANRLAEILDSHDQPELLVSSLRWNAQEDINAATELEVGQRITVHFNGTVQDSQIVSITHDIQPTRWIITLEIQKVV